MKNFIFLLIISIVGGLFAPLRIHIAHAASAPQIVNYQGRLLNSNGVPIASGTATILFTLHNSLTGGTCLWSNSSSSCATTVGRTVTITDGLFSEPLGDTGAATPYAAIPATVFANNTNVYLEVVVNGETLSPRKQILASPFALNSNTLTGLAPTTVGGTSSAVAAFDGNGALTITGNPLGSGVAQGSLFINPSGGDVAAGDTLLGVAVGGAGVFKINSLGVASLTRTSSGQFFGFSDGTDAFGVYNTNGAPNGVISADIGSLATDTTNGVLYIKTTDTVNTGWVAMGTSTDAFVQSGNSFASAAILGTNDNNTLSFETNGTTRFTIDASLATLTGVGATSLVGGSTLDLLSGAGSALSVTSGTTGALTLDSGTSGAINLGTGSTGKTINIGTGTGGNTINIATGAGANTVTIGSTTGASSLSLRSGTGGVTLAPSSTGDTNFTLDADSSALFNFSSSGTSGVTFMYGSYGSATTLGASQAITGLEIDLNTNVTANATGNSMSAIVASIGNGGSGITTGIAIGGSADIGVQIDGATTDIASGLNQDLVISTTGTGNAYFDSGATGSVNIGVGSNSKTVTVGSVSGTSSLVLDAGTGSINIGTSATSRSINIGTGAAAQTISLGNSTGATGITLTSGAGGVTFAGNTSVSGSNTFTVGAGATVLGGTLAVTGATTLSGTLNSNGDTVIGNSSADTVTFNALVASAILPSVDDTYALGSATARWSDVYIGPTTVHVGSSAADEGIIGYDTAGNIFNIGTDGTTNGDIAFFTDDLYLDKSTGRIGIGNAIPTTTLDLTGTFNATGAATLGGTLAVTGTTTLSSTLAANGGATLIGSLTLSGAEIAGASPLVFEGATADAFETTLVLVDPTADRTITFPNTDGIALLDTTGFSQGGNSLGAALTIGTNDANNFSLETNGITRATFTTANGLVFPNGMAITSSSAGDISFTTDTTGALTLDSGTSGAINLGTGSTGKTINIGTGTGGNTINIATGAGANTVTIGSTTGASSLSLRSGTGGVTLAPSSTGDTNFTLDADSSALFNFSSSGTSGVTFMYGSYGSATTLGANQPITGLELDLLTNVTANATGNSLTGITVAVGNGGTATSSGIAIAGSPDIGVQIDGATTDIASAAGQDLVLSAAGSGNLVMDSASTGNVQLGTGGNSKAVTVGSTSGTSSLTLNSGTGAISLGTSAAARTINLGTGAALQTITVGSTNGASTLTLQSGSGALTINSGTGTINLGSSASARSVNIGTGAAAQTVTIGSTDTTSSLALNSGSGNIVMTGNVGIGTAPSAQLHTTGTVRFAAFGAGTLTTDASGNVSVLSDERLKNIEGYFTTGMSALHGIQPIAYKWNAISGMEQENTYYGFSAQNLQENIPEAVMTNSQGYLTISDRPILAALINASKELDARITALENTEPVSGIEIATIGSAGSSTEVYSSLELIGTPYFNNDMGGFAVVLAGEQEVRVDFSAPYLVEPVVNATISFEQDELGATDNTMNAAIVLGQGVDYVVTKKSSTGFTIRLAQPASVNTPFSWMALAVRDARTVFSIRDASASPVIPAQANGGSSSQGAIGGTSDNNGGASSGEAQVDDTTQDGSEVFGDISSTGDTVNDASITNTTEEVSAGSELGTPAQEAVIAETPSEPQQPVQDVAPTDAAPAVDAVAPAGE